MSSYLSPKICISKFLTLSSLGRMHYVPTVICEPAINNLNMYLMIVIKPDLVYHAHVTSAVSEIGFQSGVCL